MSLCLTADTRDLRPHPDSPPDSRQRSPAAACCRNTTAHQQHRRPRWHHGFRPGHVAPSCPRNEHVTVRKRADRGQKQNRLKCAHCTHPLWPDKAPIRRHDGRKIPRPERRKQRSSEVMSYLIPSPMNMCRPLQTYRTEPKEGPRMTPAHSQRSAHQPGR